MGEPCSLEKNQATLLSQLLLSNQSTAGSRSRQANSSRGPAKSQKSDPNALVHSSAVKDKKLRVAPIYDWELRSSAKPQTQPQQQVPEGFEFQVKLSKEEFETLM